MTGRCFRRSKLLWCLLVIGTCGYRHGFEVLDKRYDLLINYIILYCLIDMNVSFAALLVIPSLAAKNNQGKNKDKGKNNDNKNKGKNNDNKNKGKNNDNKNKGKNNDNKDKGKNNDNKDKGKNNDNKNDNGDTNTPIAGGIPAPLTTKEKLKRATSCMKDKKLDLITNEKELKSTIKVWNKLNNTVPLSAVQPSSVQDVSDAISCMYTNGIRSVPLSGGHSYEGLSVLPSTVSLDLSKMKNVALNVDSTIDVQSGALLGDIYYTVWKNSAGKYAVVGSSCPSLGTGHILGGGLSSMSRMFGLACDQLISLTMVDYKGEIMQVTPDSNPDLFWSACGGGGGNFGVVTDYKIKTVNVPPEITSFSFVVKRNGRDFLEHIQNDVAVNANSLISGLRVSLEMDSVVVEGLYLGPKSNLDDALKEADLKAYADSAIDAKAQSWIEYIMMDAKSLNCSNAKNPQDLEKVPKDASIYASMDSFYVLPSKPLESAAYQTLLDWRGENKDGVVEINVLGPTSAIAARDTYDTAYPYRSALLAVQYGTRWNNTKSSNENIRATSKLTEKVNPYLSNPDPPRVVNFLDIQSPSLTGYYGVNLPRLAAIKTAYDPQNYFQNPLTIPPLVMNQAVQPGQQEKVPETGQQGTSGDTSNDAVVQVPTIGQIVSGIRMPTISVTVLCILSVL